MVLDFSPEAFPPPFYINYYLDQLPHLCNPHRGTFYQVHSVSSVEQAGPVIHIRAKTQGGQDISIRLEFLTMSIFRLQMGPVNEIPAHLTPMLVDSYWSGPAPELIHEEHKVLLITPALELTIGLDPWSLAVMDRQGREVTREFDDRSPAGIPFALKLGYLTDTQGNIRTFDSWYLHPDESIYGLGEQFAPLDRRGKTFYLWNVDAGTTSTERAYKNVPFYMSSQGYGLFINTPSRVTVQAGSLSTIALNFEVEEPDLDVFFFYGPSFKKILADYTWLTGRPPVVPRWSFGYWASRYSFHTQEEVLAVARRFRAEKIPADLVHLDPDWMRPNHYADLEWDLTAFPDPEGIFRELKEIGFKVSLWEQPYIPKGTERFQEGAARGYFVRTADGTPYLFRDFMDNVVAAVDFTNPDARLWFQARHRELLAMGATVFKTDMGEAIPEDAVFFDGTTGRQSHNVYSLLYNRAAYETAADFSKDSALVWCRSAWAGSQRYPVHWGGDPTCRFEDMVPELWGGLGLGLSGFAYWSHDIGGTLVRPTPELYIRWAEFGLLSSHARAHGMSPREPWEYGQEAERIFKAFVELRYRLIPYFYSLAHTAHETGLPLMRALALEFQDDLASRHVGSEYMLGPSLLVAPVMDESSRREVYLPPGEWLDWWTKEVSHGPGVLSMAVPLDRIPLFLRQDSMLPLGELTQWVGEKIQTSLELHLFIESQGSITVYDEEDHPFVLQARSIDNRLFIDLPVSPYNITLVIYGKKPKKIFINEKEMTLSMQRGDSRSVWIVPFMEMGKE